MLRREYKLYKSVENRNALTVLYDREDYDIITTFMITEVTDFYPHIYKELEAVVTGQWNSVNILDTFWEENLKASALRLLDPFYEIIK